MLGDDGDKEEITTKLTGISININLAEETERLATFTDWPNIYIKPEMLARAGLYFTGKGDRVACAFCPIGIHRWEAGDVPIVEHHRWNSCCPLLHGRSINKPICIDALNEDIKLIAIDDESVDECGTMPGLTLPKMSLVQNRLETFKYWPAISKMKPKHLAKAGFFYTGFEDTVKCFACKGILKHWDDDDTAIDEHMKYFPQCKYINRVYEFIIKEQNHKM